MVERLCLHFAGSNLCNRPSGHAGGCVFDTPVAIIRSLEGKLRDIVRLAEDLHAEVEMGESVGICLSDRVPSLRLGSALAALTPSNEQSEVSIER